MSRDGFKAIVQRGVGGVSAALSILGNRARGRLGILMYHRVAPRTVGVPEPTMNVTPTSFRKQMLGLQRAGYCFVGLRDALTRLEHGESLAESSVIVTFDDGCQSVFTDAWPVLHELQIPATIFINTAYLDSADPFPFDKWGVEHHRRLAPSTYRPLTTAQCREMQASGLVELGAHTHTHADFRGRPEALEADLRQNLAELAQRFGVDRPTFAFPFGRRHLGYVDDALIAVARRAGVRCALTTECELVDPARDPFGWGRFNVYDWDSPRTLAARLRGWYDWAPRWQGRIAEWRRGVQREAVS